MTNRIEAIVKYFSQRDLTGDEIQKITGKQPILYSDLKNYTFNKLLKGAGDHQTILLQTKAVNIGHFVCVFISPDDKNVYYWDSYGLGQPDTYKNYTLFDEPLPDYLSSILASDPKKRPLIVNTEDYQSWSRGMSTCGRFSALRVNLRTLDNDEFSEMFRGNSGFLGRPDNVATILTLWSLNDIISYFNK
jgi:hypothetical protein